ALPIIRSARPISHRPTIQMAIAPKSLKPTVVNVVVKVCIMALRLTFIHCSFAAGFWRNLLAWEHILPTVSPLGYARFGQPSEGLRSLKQPGTDHKNTARPQMTVAKSRTHIASPRSIG